MNSYLPHFRAQLVAVVLNESLSTLISCQRSNNSCLASAWNKITALLSLDTESQYTLRTEKTGRCRQVRKRRDSSLTRGGSRNSRKRGPKKLRRQRTPPSPLPPLHMPSIRKIHVSQAAPYSIFDQNLRLQKAQFEIF